MIDYPISQIAAVTGGELFLPGQLRELKVNHIVTDSRTFFKGENSLFFLSRTSKTDTTIFLTNNGMKLCSFRSDLLIEAAFIFVQKHTMHCRSCALTDLYHYPVVAITGSNGKTIVKEWLYEILSGEYSIMRSPKSYNSQTGVPLSVFLMDGHFNLAIFEAGISKPGEMQKLGPVIKPDTGILTNIGDAHQENFVSKQQKTGEKLTLFNSVKNLIFCVDDEETAKTVKRFCRRKGIEEISWTLRGRDALIRFKAEGNEGNIRFG